MDFKLNMLEREIAAFFKLKEGGKFYKNMFSLKKD